MSFWVLSRCVNPATFPELFLVRPGLEARTFLELLQQVFTSWMPFLPPIQQCKSTEEKKKDFYMVTILRCIDMSAWSELFVPAPILQSLQELQFTAPTPIQALALPPAIRDRLDIVGAAETVRYNFAIFSW